MTKNPCEFIGNTYRATACRSLILSIDALRTSLSTQPHLAADVMSGNIA
jgi:hypothetical protein